ncbi:MAG: DMT family transporter [Herminiimonas sp.]|nr:DMT family transporter [Herminiimonas sp.]
MLAPKILLLTCLSMLAFAGNSLLCRLALKHTAIDAASFTSVRLVSGAIVLALIVLLRDRAARKAGAAKVQSNVAGKGGNWISALALYTYAAAFSFAYTTLPTGTGALLLFGTVQAGMIGYGLMMGERFSLPQLVGLGCAFAGLIWLVLPGVAAPPLAGALLMLLAGISWAVYSLRAKGAGDPTAVTAGNFSRAAVFALVFSFATPASASLDVPGIAYGLLSGAIASGMGYAIWYTVLRSLPATSAAVLQSSVPVLAAIGGVLLLGEQFTLRLVVAAIAILGGVSLVILQKRVPAAKAGTQVPTQNKL